MLMTVEELKQAYEKLQDEENRRYHNILREVCGPERFDMVMSLYNQTGELVLTNEEKRYLHRFSTLMIYLDRDTKEDSDRVPELLRELADAAEARRP